MANNWPVTALGDVLEIKYGKDHKKLSDGAIPCYGSGGVMRYVSEHLYDDESILIPRKGSLNNIFYVNEPFWTVDTLFWSKINKDLADPKFIYYQLKLIDFNRLNEGSAVPSMTVPILNNIKIKLPSIKIQKEVSKMLTDFDRKIELNRQTNQTLEHMAQALFKSWFVDFDPVIDNALAAGNDIPEALQHKAEQRRQAQQLPDFKPLPDDIRALFPSEFEQTDEPTIGISGWIPKGWKVKTIGSMNKINPESWTKKNAPESVKYVDLANAKNGTILDTVDYTFEEAPSRARRVLRQHDIIIGLVRPANRSFAYVNENGLTGSTGFAVVRALHESYRAFTYLSLTNDDSITEFARIADGAAYPAIKPEDVTNAICIYSCDEILKRFEDLAGKFLLKKAANEKQLPPLTEIRDTLLPKLISGELEVTSNDT